MRRMMLGLVSSLALSCHVHAQDAAVNAAAPSAPAASAATQAAVMAPAMTQAPLPAPLHKSYTEGQKLEAAGALYSTRDGRIVLKTPTGEVFILLENQNLWRMEQRAAFGEREFRVRGQISKYQERYYLSVGKIVETGVKLKHDKPAATEADDEEKPFWERLMFWKNS